MLPRFTSFDDVIDFLILCHLGILINILDVRTYQYPGCGPDDSLTRSQMDHMRRNDTNALTYRTRMEFIYTRGIAYCLLDWFAESFTFYDAEGRTVNAWATIISPLLAHQLLVIKRYKKSAPLQDSSTLGCTLKSLSHQIDILFSPDHDVYKAMAGLGIQRNTLAWPFSERYTFQATRGQNSNIRGKSLYLVRRNKNITNFKVFDIMELGTTPGDQLFLDMVQAVEFSEDLQLSNKPAHLGYKHTSTNRYHGIELDANVEDDSEVDTDFSQHSTPATKTPIQRRGVKRRREGDFEAEDGNELEGRNKTPPEPPRKLRNRKVRRT